MNDKYKKALENARNEINNIIGNCKSGMYKDINKLIGLNYAKKLEELHKKTANAQDEYTKKINTRINFAMSKLEDKSKEDRRNIQDEIRDSLVVDKEIVKAWKNRDERSKIVKGSLAAARGNLFCV